MVPVAPRCKPELLSLPDAAICPLLSNSEPTCREQVRADRGRYRPSERPLLEEINSRKCVEGNQAWY